MFQPPWASNSRMRSSRRAVAASRCADSSAISSPRRFSSGLGPSGGSVSAVETSAAAASSVQRSMNEPPVSWGDSIPGFLEPLAGALTSDRAAIRAFREGEAEAASTGPGGPLVRHRGGAGALRRARTQNAVKRKLPPARCLPGFRRHAPVTGLATARHWSTRWRSSLRWGWGRTAVSWSRRRRPRRTPDASGTRLCFLGRGMGVMNFASRRVSMSRPVGWPSASRSQWRPG